MCNIESGRFLISYDHETPAHRANVLELCRLLRAEGLTVRVDADDEGERQDWSLWMLREIKAADRVLMVVSARYRLRFEDEAPAGLGHGVEIEAKLIREAINADPRGSRCKYIPVLLPGIGVDAIPQLLQPTSASHWQVPELTREGVTSLVRLLRRPIGDPDPTPPNDPESGEGTAALWLAVASGSPAAVTDLVTAFAGGDKATAVTRFAAGDGGIALRTGTPPEIVAHLQRLVRALPHLLSRHRRDGLPVVTVGAHVDRGPVAAAAGAQWATAARVVERLHAVPRVTAVVAVTPEFHASLAGASATTPAAYQEFRRDGEAGDPIYLSAPGHAYCPEPRPDAPTGPGVAPPPGSAGPTVIGDRGRINEHSVDNSIDNSIDNSDTFHIVAKRVTVHRG